MVNLDNELYQAGSLLFWNGREDGTDASFLRWHQRVVCVDLQEAQDFSTAFVLLGFCCDAGVARNSGRVGAKEGPDAFRKILAGLPVHFSQKYRLLDAGNILCPDDDLEEAQQALSITVATIVANGGFPILLGGGHEIAYGHFCGLKNGLNKTIGVINLDAHFDIREPKEGMASSGTGFYQMVQDAAAAQLPFHYMVIGIQEISNTKALFDDAAANGVDYILAHEIHADNVNSIIDRILAFAAKVDVIYLTIDMDVFAAAHAPGVSAPAFNGIVPDRPFQQLFQTIISLPNLRSMDLAELNPAYDLDNRTAKLGADLIFKVLQQRK